MFSDNDAIEERNHLHELIHFKGLSFFIGGTPRCSFYPFNETVGKYLAEEKYKEAFEASTEKFNAILKECRSKHDEIISNIPVTIDVGLVGFHESLESFIHDKTINTGISFRLSKSLLKDRAIAEKVLAKSYQLEAKYRDMAVFLKGDLPYICYEISPLAAKENWLPRSFVKKIDDAKEIINSMISGGKLKTLYPSSDKVKAQDFALCLQGTSLPRPEWLEKKAKKEPTSFDLLDNQIRLALLGQKWGWLSQPKRVLLRFSIYLAKEKSEEIKVIDPQDLRSPKDTKAKKSLEDILQEKLGLSFQWSENKGTKKDVNNLRFKFTNHKGESEEIEMSLETFKHAVNVARGR